MILLIIHIFLECGNRAQIVKPIGGEPSLDDDAAPASFGSGGEPGGFAATDNRKSDAQLSGVIPLTPPAESRGVGKR